ncbi:hypothetical protein LIER_22324 [Lithospermum erythrorhizon]|uniref:Uncharacterized protein n=1 Tax=Lithospermum erythrorhizon TaxID=34254 RepID=A0AAV3QUM6_LITER
MGTWLKSTTFRAQFTVVDIPDSSYNGLIGRPILTAIKVIVSPVHLKLKFPTARGICEMSGDLKSARVCYQTSVPPANPGAPNPESRHKRKGKGEVNTMTKVEQDNYPTERESFKRATPHEEV